MRTGTPIVFVIGIVAACGGVLGDPPACKGFVHAMTSWQARCGRPEPANLDAHVAEYCAAIANAPGIDHAFEQACIDALATAECNRYPRECVAAATGTLPAGTPCSDITSTLVPRSQCRSGRCTIESGECGTCAGAPLEGERCGSGIACAPLLVCKIASGSVDGVCAKTTGNPGDICSTATDCIASTFCDYNTRVCAPRRAAGARCWSGYECTSGLVCLGNPGVCARAGWIGDACGECLDGLVCTNGRCARPTVPPGHDTYPPAPNACR